MRRKIRYYRLIWLKYDLSAGLSVFLVALPLCLGIALASGAPLYAGILSGIIGGLVKALEQIPEDSHLTMDGTDCNFIDHDILEIISEFSNKAKDRNIRLVLKNIAKVDITAIH